MRSLIAYFMVLICVWAVTMFIVSLLRFPQLLPQRHTGNEIAHMLPKLTSNLQNFNERQNLSIGDTMTSDEHPIIEQVSRYETKHHFPSPASTFKLKIAEMTTEQKDTKKWHPITNDSIPVEQLKMTLQSNGKPTLKVASSQRMKAVLPSSESNIELETSTEFPDKLWPSSNDSNTKEQSYKTIQLHSKSISRFDNRFYFIPRTTKINAMEGQFQIANRNFCVENVPYILFIVPSIHKNADIRHAIRNTYGSVAKNNNNMQDKNEIKLLFLFGKAKDKEDQDIQEESWKYGDIIQADFVDSYTNLTRKILYGLKWISLYCGDVEFVAKVDEDVFVNIPLLLDYLQKTPYNRKGAIYGHIYRGSNVARNGIWKVTTDQYPFNEYPPYACGTSYVISGNIVARLFMVSEYMPYMPIEDAFITGCLAKLIGASHKEHNSYFTHWGAPVPDPCKFVMHQKISTTKVTIPLFYKLWNAVRSYNTVCKLHIPTRLTLRNDTNERTLSNKNIVMPSKGTGKQNKTS